LNICNEEPDILECHAVAGEDCYILKVRIPNPAALEKLIERIRCKAQIFEGNNKYLFSTIKETTHVTPSTTS
jgi:DNA-binding Lrp family transcriptional regulator